MRVCADRREKREDLERERAQLVGATCTFALWTVDSTSHLDILPSSTSQKASFPTSSRADVSRIGELLEPLLESLQLTGQVGWLSLV